MDYRELKNLGLSEKEGRVYLASLELGKSTVQNIAGKAKVNRATTYVIIEALMAKGLMSSFTEGKKQFFVAGSPEKLSLLFREQAMEIQRKQEYLDKILPELKSLKQDQKEGPVVRYFEGKEGMRAMAEEFFITNHKEHARMIYSFDLLDNIFSKEEREEIQKKRQLKKVRVRSIINDKYRALKSDAEKKIVSEQQFPITADIAFFENKVRIASQKGKLAGLIIEDKEIANTFKILFDLAWKYLEGENKKKG